MPCYSVPYSSVPTVLARLIFSPDGAHLAGLARPPATATPPSIEPHSPPPQPQQLTLWEWRESRVESGVEAHDGPYGGLVWQAPLGSAEGRLVLLGRRSLLLLRPPSLELSEVRVARQR